MTDQQPGQDVNIVTLFRAAARQRADLVALVDDAGNSLTFGQWFDRSRLIAAAIQDLVPRQAPVLVGFRNSEVLDYAATFMAVVGSAAVAVPVRLPAPRSELDRIAALTGAKCLLSAKAVDAAVPNYTIGALTEGAEPADLIEKLDWSESAQILFSSGTSGLPTAIVVPHGNLAWNQKPPSATQRSRQLLLHSYPLGTSAFQTQFMRSITHDFKVRVLSVFDPKKVLRILGSENVTTVLFTPAMINILSDVISEDDVFPSVESVGATGSFMKPGQYELLKRVFPSAEIITSYGSTEASPASTSRRFDPSRPLNVGVVNPGCAIKITNDLGEELPAGEPGTIWLSALGAPARRYMDEQLNQHRFDGHWIRMGDIGHLEEDGSLVLTGRPTDVISVGGLKVSGPEVESVLSRHPAVRDIAVFAQPHPLLGEQVAAEVVPRFPVEERDIIAFARQNLAQHKVPAVVLFVDEIERNAMGKIPVRRQDR